MNSLVETTRLIAPCKVNLFLWITGIREDGYHELMSLFLPLEEPHDVLTVTPLAERSGLEVACAGLGIDQESNIVTKAMRAYGARTGTSLDYKVVLEKNTPSGAGLGGGSSDAAAMLRYLNDRAGDAALSEAELHEVATGIGADVPFFLLDGPAWAEGIGEKLEPVEVDLSGLTLVLACPDFHVSTPWAYGKWDEVFWSTKKKQKHLKQLTASFEKHKGPFCHERLILRNNLEEAVYPDFPELRRIKETMLGEGAIGAVMSGSGASQVALFRDADKAERLKSRLTDNGIPTYSFSY